MYHILLEDLQVVEFFHPVILCADIVGSVLQAHDGALEDPWMVMGEVDISVHTSLFPVHFGNCLGPILSH